MPSFEVAKRCSTVKRAGVELGRQRLHRCATPLGRHRVERRRSRACLRRRRRRGRCLSGVAEQDGSCCWPASGIAWLRPAAVGLRGVSANSLPETSSSALTHSTWSDAETSSIAWLRGRRHHQLGAAWRPAAISASEYATSVPGGKPPSGACRVTISRPPITSLKSAVSGSGSSDQLAVGAVSRSKSRWSRSLAAVDEHPARVAVHRGERARRDTSLDLCR